MIFASRKIPGAAPVHNPSQLRGFVVSAAAAGASAPWASTTLTSFIAILLLSLCFDLSPIDPLLPGCAARKSLMNYVPNLVHDEEPPTRQLAASP